MFYKHKGLPEEDEIVLCKVTKLYPNSVFVDLLEYGQAGMVHISEVSPGRIRNLRDFVSLDRQIVCKVLKIDRERGHIDLSLRRVNSNQRREKLDEIKQELKAESLVTNLAKKLHKKPEDLYRDMTAKIFKEYSHLYLCFRDLVDGETDLIKLGLEKELSKEVTDAVLEKFKPKKVIVRGEIKLQTYDPNGAEMVRALLLEIEKLSSTLSLFYLGAGRYKLMIEEVDYDAAEKCLKAVLIVLEKFNDKNSTAAFEREKSD